LTSFQIWIIIIALLYGHQLMSKQITLTNHLLLEMMMKHWISVLLTMLVSFLLITGCDKKSTRPQPTAYDNASVFTGGIMYDKFWSEEAGFDQNDTNIAKFDAYSDFFRCKQCHAWDLLGRSGSYINRAPKTTRPSVADLNLYQTAQAKSAQELFDEMKSTTDRRDISYDLSTYDPATNFTVGDQMPNFSQILTDEQIWDIVKFLKEGALDVSQLYDATYTGTYPTGSVSYSNLGRDGNVTNGATYFGSNLKCAGCHGAEGTFRELENMSLGGFTRSKPNEVQHKIRYGALGSVPKMAGDSTLSLTQVKDLYKALADTANFPD